MNKPTIGSIVTFNRDNKTYSGKVKHILPCIENGRKHAVIELLGSLPGCMHTVPLDELTTHDTRILRVYRPKIDLVVISVVTQADCFEVAYLQAPTNTDRVFPL
jgi:hypothetical protein